MENPVPNQNPTPEQQAIPLTDPKLIYCNSAFIESLSNEEMVFSFASGPVIINQFVFHPKHAKRFLLRLQEKIKEYEIKNGELKTELPK